MKILIINGPNINLLGRREKDIYGTTNYDKMCSYLTAKAKTYGIDLDQVQSNSEGEIIDYLQNAAGRYRGIIINPGAYTHYSIAILDALKAVEIPAIEVHISNIYARENFRKESVTAQACTGLISGFGIYGYIMAILGLINIANKGNE